MKIKTLLLSILILLPLAANAQFPVKPKREQPFEQGKIYVGASLSGLDLNYSGIGKLNLGVQGRVGYFAWDNIMLLADANYQHSGNDNVSDYMSIGGGGRYYINQNGIFLGANVKLVHAFHNYNDIMPGVEVGYAFFISRTVTIEPSIYYQQSFKNHSDYSQIGLRIGFGIYLE